MKKFVIVALVLGICAANSAFAAGGRDIAVLGTKNTPACTTCHGTAAAIPQLAGLSAGYMVRQLVSFAEGTRKNIMMEPVAGALSKAEREAVATYYAKLPVPKTAAIGDASKIVAGAALAQSGAWAKGVPGCSQCHGADGNGVGALVPRLAGQSPQYIEAQFDAWATGTRSGDPLGLMAGIARKLNKTEIASVAAYYAAAPNLPAPPPDSALPDNEFGKMVRLGENIFHDTQHHAAQYVGNTLNCQNCHLDGGRMAGSAPLWAAFGNYPAYRSKNGHVNTYSERLQGCFRYSMNGKVPPLGSKTLVALEAYSFFLAKGMPVGVDMPGRGYPALSKPAKRFDYKRGEKVYTQSCAICHGANGQGQKSAGGAPVFPALWGAKSFNWGSGMGDINNAAAFIKANMPFSQSGTLSDQAAWDVAAFVNSHDRPQDPRFTGSVAATRKKYHNNEMSMYGKGVNGTVLGAHSPTSGP